MIRYLGVREGGGARVFTLHYPGCWVVRWAYSDGPATVVECCPGTEPEESILCWN